MKKFSFIFITLISIMGYSQSNISKKNDLIKEGIKGIVKKITYDQGTCKERFGKMEFLFNENLGGKSEWIYEYNMSGFKTEEKFIDNNENILAYLYTYNYDSNNNLVLETNFRKNNQITFRRENKYNKQNFIIQDSASYINESIKNEVTKYLYDKSNKLLTEETFDEKGQKISECQYIYDSKNNITQSTYYINYGELCCIYKYVFDKKNNLSAKLYYDKNKKLEKKIVYKYDILRRKTEEIEYIYAEDILNNSIMNTYFKYDKFGNCINETCVFYDIRLDDHERFYHKTKKIVEFDNNNNWIKKINFFDNEISGCSIRKIEYY